MLSRPAGRELARRAGNGYPKAVKRIRCAETTVERRSRASLGRVARSGLLLRVTLAAVVAWVCGSAPSAHAAGSIHPELERALQTLDKSGGATAYSALRRVWDMWDRADPAQVEAALELASRSPKLAPSAQAYAGTLAAYARLRRGDLAAAKAQLKGLGYVSRWLVAGPFDNEGKAGLTAQHGPEADLLAPLQPAKAYTGKERPVRWRAVPDVFPYAFVDFGSLLRPETKVCGLLATFVSAADAKAARKITAWVGSGGAVRAFWNGREVLSDDTYARHDFERLAVTLELEPGPNLFVLKACGDEQAPNVSLRLGDAAGRPDASLTASNELSFAGAAAGNAVNVAKKHPKQKLLKGPEGPVQIFEGLTDKPGASAANLEAYARYLDDTDGDDPAVHLARDLARRAAEKEPTVERLLLAGRLVEDRNQVHEWLEKAEKLLKGKPNRDALLARGWHRRHGPNFREAMPYFERVLDMEPTNVSAMRGFLELYNLAGLPRTALARIERAVDLQPQSVGLLALYAAQLRTLGRSADASEVESRYHGLRFDDSSYVNAQLDLAISRKDKKSAEHWAERLVATQPHDAWALSLAARAYRRLGQPERAAATQRSALALAPEDVGTLRSLADLEGDQGHTNEQLSLLRELLRVRPQAKDVREYLENQEPEKPRPDEVYAWNADKFLYLRHAPPAGSNRRTLRDLTVSQVFQNGLSSQFRQVVFQPLTDAAAASDRQYAFGYEADRQVVQLRGAKVYRKDGKIDEAVEWGEGPADDPTIAMYTSARVFYVQFPRLEAGDVVELRYRVDDVTPRNEFADYFGEVTTMGGLEPAANVEYVLMTPSARKIFVDATHVPNLQQSKQELGSVTVHRFLAKDLKPIQAEPSMPPLSEVLPFVHVSTYENWKDLGRWYWGLVKDQFDLDDQTRNTLRGIVAGKKTNEEKVAAIYDWVTRNTRYVALEFGIYGYKPRRCVQTLSRGWGDCKDKATALVTLLKEVGIPATLVVLRTQMRGDFRSALPSFAPFDHAIAYVPSLNLFLDGTAEHTGISELPRMDLGALGMLVNEGDTKIVHLPHADPDKNFVRRTVRAKLLPSGEGKLELEYATGGFVSAEWRRRYHAESTRRDRVNSDLGGEDPGFELLAGAQGLTSSNLEDATTPVKITVKGNAANFARKESGELSMSVTSSLRLTPTFAALGGRTQDVSTLGFSTTEDSVTVDLPPGAEVVSAPESAKGDSRFGSYSVEVSKEKDKVLVKSRVAVKVSRITPKDYADWKKFCEEADRALSPRLVVRP